MCEIKHAGVWGFMAILVLCGMLAGCSGRRARNIAPDAVVIDDKCLLEDNPRSHFSRRVNNAPLNGETVNLNPPRFRWSYTPNYRYTYPSTEPRESLFMFVFQIADEPSFKSPLVSAVTHVNFYNTLAPLKGPGPFYWRVGYIAGASAEGKEPSHWSPAREFRIAPDALVWDRSSLARPDFSNRPHPRILISKDNRRRILHLIETDAHHKYMFDQMRQAADATIAAPWYVNFMKSDKEEGGGPFYHMAKKLCNVAFIYKLTGEKKYAGVIDRAVTVASWPSGGRSSPEPIGDAGADASQTTEY
ncbi:MAG: DUF4962 domain-containing protein, partial [Planctomycetes bacterium]|nr:DUF4962 domain-containing protein [Planctomycetota bacterium]